MKGQAKKHKYMKRLFLFIIFSAPLFCFAQDWETSGYVKYLYSHSKIPLLNVKPLIDNQLHLRLNNRLYLSDFLSASLELRIRAFQGGSVSRIPGFTSGVVTTYPYADLSVQSVRHGEFFAYGQIDRVALDYNSGNWDFTLGRQRVAWGTSLVWNVIDLFNPQSVLDFDYEEKPGSDALRVQYFTGAVGRVEAVIKPAPKSNDRTFALLWMTNSHDYDFYTILAWMNKSPVFGAAFSGDIQGAGFRGEMRLTGKPSREALGDTWQSFIENYSEAQGANLSAVLSIDYTFRTSLYLHGETLYNSLGKSANAAFYAQQANRAGLLSPARWSLFGEMAYDINPLLRGDIFMLVNPNDRSYVMAPSLSWSVITNLDLYVIGLLADGGSSSEFGNFGRAVFLRSKYSF